MTWLERCVLLVIIALVGLLIYAAYDHYDASFVLTGQITQKEHFAAYTDYHTTTIGDGSNSHTITTSEYHPEAWVIVIVGKGRGGKIRNRTITIPAEEWMHLEIGQTFTP